MKLQKTPEGIAEYIVEGHYKPFKIGDIEYNGDIFYSEINQYINSEYGKRNKMAKDPKTFEIICNLLRIKFKFYIHSWKNYIKNFVTIKDHLTGYTLFVYN